MDEMMRIISGKYKGRNLVNFKAPHIRPTTDRVKETIFNKLMAYWDGARVLDLFSGTGNLSFEALSRGVSYVESVENNSKSINIIGKNMELLKIKTEMKLIQKDVLSYLKAYQSEPFDIILIDPPFTKKMAHDCMLELANSKVLSKDSLIMIESSDHERMDEEYGDLIRYDKKNFGDKTASFFETKEI